MVLVNSNPATIMTDPGTADRTYVGPMTPELVEQIIAKVSELDAVRASGITLWVQLGKQPIKNVGNGGGQLWQDHAPCIHLSHPVLCTLLHLPQERPDAILPTMGGQTGLNLAKALSEQGILDK